MKKLFTLALAVVSLPPVAAWSRQQQPQQQPPAASAPRWQTYTYRGEEFSVSLPEMPALTQGSRAVKDRPNDRDSLERGFGAYADGVVYEVWSYEKPRDGEDVDYFAQYFKTYNLPRTAVSERRAVTLGGFGGKHYTFTSERSPGDEFSIYVYRARRHAYVVTAYGAGERDASVRRFFESFSLSDSPAGTPVNDDSPPIFAKWKDGKRKDELAKWAVPDFDRQSVQTGSRPAGAPPAASAPVDYTSPFKAAEVTRRAAVIFRPGPPYTEEARKNQITGTVTLRLVLSADGTVSYVAAVARLPDGLTEMAAHAARGIKFIPAERDGRRVSQWVTVEYNFNIY